MRAERSREVAPRGRPLPSKASADKQVAPLVSYEVSGEGQVTAQYTPQLRYLFDMLDYRLAIVGSDTGVRSDGGDVGHAGAHGLSSGSGPTLFERRLSGDYALCFRDIVYFMCAV
jgi:hypothetical protein